MILTEQKFTDIQTLTEGKDASKKLYLVGTMMESEQKNRNGRTYKKSEIANAVQKIQEAAKQGRNVLGALDHPSNSLEVKLKDVSHKLIEARMDGNDAICKAEIITTVPNGVIAKGLIDNGINIGVSSRGSGMVNEETNIVEGFDFVTIDLVANPSAISAYPQTITEALDMYRRGYVIDDLAYASIHDPKAQKYFSEEIKKFIQSEFNK